MSVVVPAYEQEALALQAVQSALAQDYPNLEVLLVDDASPSTHFPTLQMIDDARLRIIRNPSNLGRVGNYRHALYTLARGDWVVNLDGDDEFTDPGFISAAMAAALHHPKTVVVAARCATVSRHGLHTSVGPGNAVYSGIDVVAALPMAQFLFMHLATIYRREPALAVDFYRRCAISADWDSLYRLAVTGDVVFLDRVVGTWRLHGSNATATADWRQMAENLGIWPPIYRAAVAAGLAPSAARRACRRCLVHFGRLQLPTTMRGPRPSDGLRYLRELWRLDWQAGAWALASLPTLARLCAGLLGYYRGRAF